MNRGLTGTPLKYFEKLTLLENGSQIFSRNDYAVVAGNIKAMADFDELLMEPLLLVGAGCLKGLNRRAIELPEMIYKMGG